DTLLYLVRHQGKVLGKEELMSALWPDAFVEENNLTQSVSTLRRALGEARGENRYIVTVPGHGYRFAAEVTTPNATGDAPPAGDETPLQVGDVAEVEVAGASAATASREKERKRLVWRMLVIGLLAVLLGVVVLYLWRARTRTSPSGHVR